MLAGSVQGLNRELIPRPAPEAGERIARLLCLPSAGPVAVQPVTHDPYVVRRGLPRELETCLADRGDGEPAGDARRFRIARPTGRLGQRKPAHTRRCLRGRCTVMRRDRRRRQERSREDAGSGEKRGGSVEDAAPGHGLSANGYATGEARKVNGEDRRPTAGPSHRAKKFALCARLALMADAGHIRKLRRSDSFRRTDPRAAEGRERPTTASCATEEQGSLRQGPPRPFLRAEVGRVPAAGPPVLRRPP